MSTDAASIGSSFSDFSGNSGAAGGATPAILIDTKPLEQLAQYTMLYNKAKYDQNQKDTDAKVAQLADLSKISLNDLRGKDKDQAAKEFTDLLGSASEFARQTPKNNQEKIQQQLDWQTKFGAFMNNYTSGKGRAVSYQAHVNTIKNNTTDPKAQDLKISNLNREFDNTDIGTQISAVPQYKTENIDIPNAVISNLDTVGIGPNQNTSVKLKYFNPKVNSGNADGAVLGINNAYIPKKVKGSNGAEIDNPNYVALSQNQKDQNDLQNITDSQAKVWTDMAEPFNAVRKNYVDADGNFNAKKFEDENASNSVVMRAYNAIKTASDYSHGKFNEATNGIFNDKGLTYQLPPTIDPNDFKAGFVDLTKDVTPNQLAMAGIFSKFQGDEATKTITHTGDQKAFDLAKMKDQGENYRKGLEIAKDKYIANLPYEKQKAGAVNANGDPIDFGNLIYGVNSGPKETLVINQTDGTKVDNVKINNGVVVDGSGAVVNYTGDLKIPASYLDNSIVTEYNKYAGSTKVAADGSTSTNAPSKLLLQNGKYTVRMVNGEIQGIQTITDDGSGGSFASANQFQHITLEAGQKGASKYKRADKNYGKQQETPVVNTNKQTSTTTSLDPNGFKKEGDYYRYKDGTLYDATGKIIKK